MESRNTNNSLLKTLDWPTVIIYLLLVTAGVFSIYSASYDFDNASIISFDEFSGKQLLWVGLALAAGGIILLVNFRVFETYAYPIYGLMLLLLIATIFLAPDIKGSRSWLVLGPVSLQPAEFAKCATSLALARLFSSYNFTLNGSPANYVRAIAIIVIPIGLILAQKETGSALAYLALFFVLYREGMSGLVLMAALCAVVFFITMIKYTETIVMGIPSGEMAVFIMIEIIILGMVAGYCRMVFEARYLLIWYLVTGLIAWGLCAWDVNVPGDIYFLCVIGVSILYCVFLLFQGPMTKLLITIGAAVCSIAFMFSVDKVFNDVLMTHQQQRIKVAFGIVEDPRGIGYNVNQSRIAIGSGGVAGKGFLNGTQTKLKYVPEQHTDFIFCTIGEEEGFIGSTAVLIVFLALILRLIRIAERQRTAFGRVYAYCVVSFLIFHLCINIGMVIGLCPVIGIPLPFFSYGGSALWGFTILLFILLRIDAARKERRE